MNNGHKTIVAMLAVVAVLLVLNIVQGPRAAEAQEISGDGDPYVVKYLAHGDDHYLRVWSDAQVDEFRRVDSMSCSFEFEQILGLPIEYPFDVVDANGSESGVMLEFADDRVAFYKPLDLLCTITGDGSAPLCLGDVDRDGDNDFDDLLYVLSGWGPCE